MSEPKQCEKCLLVYPSSRGACPNCIDPLTDLKQLVTQACADGNWNYDPYLHGMANGMICAVAVLEGSEPTYLDPPEIWGRDKEDMAVDGQLTVEEVIYQCDTHGLMSPNTECAHISPAGCRHCGVCAHQVEQS